MPGQCSAVALLAGVLLHTPAGRRLEVVQFDDVSVVKRVPETFRPDDLIMHVDEAKLLINAMRTTRSGQDGSLAQLTIDGRFIAGRTYDHAQDDGDEEGWPATTLGWKRLFHSESTMLMERANVL
jgi:hypothetical protein